MTVFTRQASCSAAVRHQPSSPPNFIAGASFIFAPYSVHRAMELFAMPRKKKRGISVWMPLIKAVAVELLKFGLAYLK
ncbi:hypothetical protein [Novosphingobium lindaniclasticum]